MFWRLLLQLLRGSRGRLTVALIALVSGSAVISALLNLEFDIEHKLTQEFRTLGANVVISPGRGAAVSGAEVTAAALMDSVEVLKQISQNSSPEMVAAAPFLYVVARATNKPVVVAGTWLDEINKLNPTWKLEGASISSREDELRCLIGRNVARQFHLTTGNQIELTYLGETTRLNVAGIVDAGGTDDNQIFVNLPVAQNLAHLRGKIGVVQLSVSGSASAISNYVATLSKSLSGFDVRPIHQVTDAESGLLDRIRTLIVSMVLLILVLTALCVLATMAALAMERREDVGLMKAIGGPISRIVKLFLAEVGVLGAAGGLIGCIAGIGLSHWIGWRVFGTAISVRWELFPLTIALMVAVALMAALPLRLLGKVKPAVILRGE